MVAFIVPRINEKLFKFAGRKVATGRIAAVVPAKEKEIKADDFLEVLASIEVKRHLTDY